MKFKGAIPGLVVLLVVSTFPLGAQTAALRRISASITYVSSGTVYISAGRERGLEVGDTMTVVNRSVLRGRVAIKAISSNSSAASIVSQLSSFAVGDSAYVDKEKAVEQPREILSQRKDAAGSIETEASQISGRVALQYAGAGSLPSRTDFSQPSLLVQLNMAKLGGTGLNLQVYGRAYRDLSPLFSRYDPEGSRSKVRMYELSLSQDEPSGWGGYSLGRVTSRFVGGLGTFDGVQAYVRGGNWTAGVVAGLQPDFRTSGIDAHQQKAALFVNYAWGPDVFRTSDITLAYGQQRYNGRIDRVFMYLQSAARFSQTLSLYESSEFDLETMDHAVRKKTFQPTNAFISMSYSPNSWLNTSIGYDATRTLYLLESMSAIPDTLLDKELHQGVRINASVRAPLNIVFLGNASYRGEGGGGRGAHTLGGGFRISDIAQSSFNVGAQYEDIHGLFTKGSDVTFDLDRWVAMFMLFSLRYDRYSYTLLSDGSAHAITTASLNFNCSISRKWYTVLSLDQIWDNALRNQRVFVEIGMRL